MALNQSDCTFSKCYFIKKFIFYYDLFDLYFFFVDLYLFFVKDSCAEQIKVWVERISNSQPNTPNNYGLIIDGQTLQFALEKPLDMKFLELAKSCQVVVCCRAAPVQKVSYFLFFKYLLFYLIHYVLD